jgi:hypothetical protein
VTAIVGEFTGPSSGSIGTRVIVGGTGNGGGGRGTALLIKGPGSSSEEDLVKINAFTLAGPTTSQTGELAIETADAGVLGERARFTSDGIEVTGSILASTGILFGTDTAAANTLDDYEEGTWTPEDYEGNVSLSINNAAYIKIGSLVHFELDIVVATNSETDSLRITLPFSTVGKGSSVVGFSQASVGDTRAGTQSNTIFLWEGDGGTNQSFDQYSGDALRISGNYITS